jgi:hypothetical protein
VDLRNGWNFLQSCTLRAELELGVLGEQNPEAPTDLDMRVYLSPVFRGVCPIICAT